MGDYKWFTALTDTSCKMCVSAISAGTGFYYEAKRKEHFCRDCGRDIRTYGESVAQERAGRAGLGTVLRKLFGV